MWPNRLWNNFGWGLTLWNLRDWLIDCLIKYKINLRILIYCTVWKDRVIWSAYGISFKWVLKWKYPSLYRNIVCVCHALMLILIFFFFMNDVEHHTILSSFQRGSLGVKTSCHYAKKYEIKKWNLVMNSSTERTNECSFYVIFSSSPFICCSLFRDHPPT